MHCIVLHAFQGEEGKPGGPGREGKPGKEVYSTISYLYY